MARTGANLEGCYFNQDDRKWSHILRYTWRTARFDIERFCAGSAAERMEQWLQWTQDGEHGQMVKRQVAVLLFERRGAAWSEAEIEGYIAEVDARVERWVSAAWRQAA